MLVRPSPPIGVGAAARVKERVAHARQATRIAGIPRRLTPAVWRTSICRQC